MILSLRLSTMEKIRLIFCSKIFSRKKALGTLDLLALGNQFFTQMAGTVTLKDLAQSMEITDFICKDFLETHLIQIMEI